MCTPDAFAYWFFPVLLSRAQRLHQRLSPRRLLRGDPHIASHMQRLHKRCPGSGFSLHVLKLPCWSGLCYLRLLQFDLHIAKPQFPEHSHHSGDVDKAVSLAWKASDTVTSAPLFGSARICGALACDWSRRSSKRFVLVSSVAGPRSLAAAFVVMGCSGHHRKNLSSE